MIATRPLTMNSPLSKSFDDDDDNNNNHDNNNLKNNNDTLPSSADISFLRINTQPSK